MKMLIGLWVGSGMMVLNLDVLVMYTEIKHDNPISAVLGIVIIPVIIGGIAAAIADITTGREADAVEDEPCGQETP